MTGHALSDPGVAGDVGLHDLFAREWAFRLAEDPLLATSVGAHDANDALPSVAAADQKRRAAVWTEFLAELDGLDPSGLDSADRIHADIWRAQLEDFIAAVEFGAYEIPLNADSGFHIALYS